MSSPFSIERDLACRPCSAIRLYLHFSILAVSLMCAEAVVAQTLPPQVIVAQAAAPERSRPSLDLAQFQDAKRVNYLDVSYAVAQPAADAAAALLLDLRIYKDDSLWAAKVWKLEERESAPAHGPSRHELVDRLRYVVAEQGRYRAVLRVRATPHAVADSAVATLHTRDFAETQVELSDVILAAEINRVSAPAGAYEILPNPRLIYGEPLPVLLYYFEAYNLITGCAGASYKSCGRVEDDNGAVVEGLVQPYRTKKKTHDFSVEMGSIDISSLPSGVYTLVYGIADSAQNLQSSRRKRFYIYNPANGAPAPAERAAASVLAQASEAALDDEFARLQYVLQSDEKKMYESLANAQAKMAFILSLWEAHKPEEYSSGLVYRRVYLERAREAEGRFATAFRPGWKSDRGRVFIVYGPPSNIEREPNNPTVKPYEVWRYDEIQGGVIFVFADRTGFKNYELIHSTHRNELRNADWQRLVTIENNQPQGMQ